MHEIFSQMNNYFQSLGIYGLALNSFVESFFLVNETDSRVFERELVPVCPEGNVFVLCKIQNIFSPDNNWIYCFNRFFSEFSWWSSIRCMYNKIYFFSDFNRVCNILYYKLYIFKLIENIFSFIFVSYKSNNFYICT